MDIINGIKKAFDVLKPIMTGLGIGLIVYVLLGGILSLIVGVMDAIDKVPATSVSYMTNASNQYWEIGTTVLDSISTVAEFLPVGILILVIGGIVYFGSRRKEDKGGSF
jgi:hypothetical protein